MNLSLSAPPYSHSSHKTASSIFVWAAYVVNHVHWSTCLASLSRLTFVFGFFGGIPLPPHDPISVEGKTQWLKYGALSYEMGQWLGKSFFLFMFAERFLQNLPLKFGSKISAHAFSAAVTCISKH